MNWKTSFGLVLVMILILSSCQSSSDETENEIQDRVKKLNREIAKASFSSIDFSDAFSESASGGTSKNSVPYLNFELLTINSEKATLNIQANFDQLNAKSYLEKREKLEETLKKEGISKIEYRILEQKKDKKTSLFPKENSKSDSFEFSTENTFSQNTFSQNTFSQKRKAKINEDFVRLREEPSLSSPIVSYLFQSTPVNIQERSTQPQSIQQNKAYWYQIQTENQQEGWVFGLYLSPIDLSIDGNPQKDKKSDYSLVNNKIYQDFLKKYKTLIPNSYQEQLPKQFHSQNIGIQAKRLLVTLNQQNNLGKEEKLLIPFEIRGKEIKWYPKSISILSKKSRKNPSSQEDKQKERQKEKQETNSSVSIAQNISNSSNSLRSQIYSQKSEEGLAEGLNDSLKIFGKKASLVPIEKPENTRKNRHPNDLIELSLDYPELKKFLTPEILEQERTRKAVIPSEEIIVLELSPSPRTIIEDDLLLSTQKNSIIENSLKEDSISLEKKLKEQEPNQLENRTQRSKLAFQFPTEQPWLAISWSPYLERELSQRDRFKMLVLKKLLELRSSDEISIRSKTSSKEEGKKLWLQILDLRFAEQKASIGIGKKDPSSKKKYWKRWDLDFHLETGIQSETLPERKKVSTRALLFLESQKNLNLKMQKNLWQISEWMLNLVEGSKNSDPPQSKDIRDYTS